MSSKNEIKVKPVPENGKPENFSGLVGEFQINAEGPKGDVIKNKPFRYSLKVEGVGGLFSLKDFFLQGLEGLEIYDLKTESSISKSGVSQKTFEFYLTPRKEGDLKIPSQTLVVFNPKKEIYEVLKTSPINIKAQEGKIQEGEFQPKSFLASGSEDSQETFLKKLKSSPKKVFVWSLKGMVWTYSGTLIFIILFFLGVNLLGTRKQEDELVTLQNQFMSLKSYFLKKAYRKGALEVLKTLEKIVLCLSKDRKFFQYRKTFDLSTRIKQCPLKMQEILFSKGEELYEKWEALAFAPENLLEPIERDQQSLDNLLKETELLIEQIMAAYRKGDEA